MINNKAIIYKNGECDSGQKELIGHTGTPPTGDREPGGRHLVPLRGRTSQLAAFPFYDDMTSMSTLKISIFIVFTADAQHVSGLVSRWQQLSSVLALAACSLCLLPPV